MKAYTIEDLLTYKQQKCQNSNCIQQQRCFFYHNDFDRRRPVLNDINSKQPYKYFHEDCLYQNSSDQKRCKDGDNCKFAHNLFEKNFHPMMIKKEECEMKKNNEKCPFNFLEIPDYYNPDENHLLHFCPKYHFIDEQYFFESPKYRYNLDQYNILLEKEKKDRGSFVFITRKQNHESLLKNSMPQQGNNILQEIQDQSQESQLDILNQLDETEITPYLFESDTSYIESKIQQKDNKKKPQMINNAVNNIKHSNNNNNTQNQTQNMSILKDLEIRNENLHMYNKMSPNRNTDNSQILSQSIIADIQLLSENNQQPLETINQSTSERKYPRLLNSEERKQVSSSKYSPQTQNSKSNRTHSECKEIQDNITNTQPNACEFGYQNMQTPQKKKQLSPQRGNRSNSATRSRKRESSKSASHKKYSLERISQHNYKHSEENLEKARKSVMKSYSQGDRFGSEESEWLELKDISFTKNETLNIEKIQRTIIAFLNREGGFIVFGVNDDSRIIGVSKTCTLADLKQKLQVELDKCQPTIEWGKQIFLSEKELETNYSSPLYQGNQNKLIVLEVKPQKDWTKKYVNDSSKYAVRWFRSAVTLEWSHLVNHLREQGEKKKKDIEDCCKQQQDILKELSKQLTKWQNEQLSVEEIKEKTKEMLKKAKRQGRKSHKDS